jgi:hypothetical protein
MSRDTTGSPSSPSAGQGALRAPKARARVRLASRAALELDAARLARETGGDADDLHGVKGGTLRATELAIDLLLDGYDPRPLMGIKPRKGTPPEISTKGWRAALLYFKVRERHPDAQEKAIVGGMSEVLGIGKSTLRRYNRVHEKRYILAREEEQRQGQEKAQMLVRALMQRLEPAFRPFGLGGGRFGAGTQPSKMRRDTRRQRCEPRFVEQRTGCSTKRRFLSTENCAPPDNVM